TTGLFATKGAAQSPQTQARGVPVFEVDPTWPRLPPQFKLGDASSFAIDAQDNVWLLHRPRTLKPEDAGKAAPAIVVFDAAGNFIKAWGGAGSGGYGNHRVIIFDADTGAFKRMWGAFGKPPGGEDSCAIVSPKTFPDPEGPAHFNVAHAIRVAN